MESHVTFEHRKTSNVVMFTIPQINLEGDFQSTL